MVRGRRIFGQKEIRFDLRMCYTNKQSRIGDKGYSARGEFRPRQTRQLPRAVDLKGRILMQNFFWGGEKGIFKPTVGNDSLHHDMDNKGVRILKFATSKNPGC